MSKKAHVLLADEIWNENNQPNWSFLNLPYILRLVTNINVGQYINYTGTTYHLCPLSTVSTNIYLVIVEQWTG